VITARSLLVVGCCMVARHDLAQGQQLTAYVLPDNDLPFEEHPTNALRTPVPRVVQQRLDSIVDFQRARWACSFGGTDSIGPRASAFGPLYRIRVPGGRTLYFFEGYNPLGYGTHVLLLFDSTSKAVTKEPVELWGKWTDLQRYGIATHQAEWTTLRKPLIGFEDVDGDGRPELVVEEVVHNGTVYNAVAYYYFHMGDDLALHQVLSIETRAVDLYTPKETGVVLRVLSKGAPRELLLSTYVEDSAQGKPRRKVGNVTLRTTRSGEAFRVVKMVVFDQRYASLLVTSSGMQEDEFLAHGYTFWY